MEIKELYKKINKIEPAHSQLSKNIEYIEDTTDRIYQNQNSIFVPFTGIGYNSFSRNYDKVHFFYNDSIRKISLNDSIQFKGLNSNIKLVWSVQHKYKNKMLLDILLSASLPFTKHMQLNHYTIGVGYCFNIHKYILIKPLFLLEANRYYYKLTPYSSSTSALFINGKNMGESVNIRYMQSSCGITPKVSITLLTPRLLKNETSQISFDVGYHIPLYETASIEFKKQAPSFTRSSYYNGHYSRGWGWAVIELISAGANAIYRNITKQNINTKDHLFYDGQNITNKLISPNNIYFELKFGFQF